MNNQPQNAARGQGNYFSAADTLGDIMKTPQGRALVNELIRKASTEMNMKLNLNAGLISMFSGFTVEKLFQMGGAKVPPQIRQWVCEQLGKIPKP